MNDDDLSKTLIIPNPGGRKKTDGPVFSQTMSSPITSNPQSLHADYFEGENVILSSARNILILASNLRSLEPKNSIEQLRHDIEQLIVKFDQQLCSLNLRKEVVLTARYLICCLLDELILATPWGSDSIWSQQTLLGKYHNETSGGEKFFVIINKLIEQSQRNIDLIELSYVCLSAGFCGKYRISQQGENELIKINQKLYQEIEQYRTIDRDLSPHWQGSGQIEQKMVKHFPVSFILMFFGVVIIAVYIGLLSSLKTKVEPLYQKIESIGWADFVSSMNVSQSHNIDINAIAEKLKNSLDKYIKNKVIAIDVRDQSLIVRLISTSLFKSGSSIINEDALPDVNVLVNNIKDYSNNVLVIGHTDSTGKANSNWVISRKRAEAIAQWLTKSNYKLINTVTRGVADTQPLVTDTDNDYNQSLNRRVELILVLKG